MKKKVSAMLLCGLCMLWMASGTALSADASVKMRVSISDAGILRMSAEEITVSDVNADGKITAYDALYAAHEKAYPAGAAAGFSAEDAGWGTSVSKLWGIENGGSYGYYLNNEALMNLDAEVKDGDHLYAYSYADLEFWSDSFSYFDILTKTVKSGDEVTLVLMGAGYDADWNPVTAPVADAVILLNGEESKLKTDADGKVTIPVTGKKNMTVSAVKEGVVLVPPVCVLTMERPSTVWVLVFFALFAATAVLVAWFIYRRRKLAK